LRWVYSTGLRRATRVRVVSSGVAEAFQDESKILRSGEWRCAQQ
jgi:hypothetical protein